MTGSVAGSIFQISFSHTNARVAKKATSRIKITLKAEPVNP